MKYQKKILTIISFIMLISACQDPIFWTQEHEARTRTNNLPKNTRIPDVDADDNYLYSIVGGILYRRARGDGYWSEYSLPQQAHSLDVKNGLIALSDGIFYYDFQSMSLQGRHESYGNAKRAYIDKLGGNSIVVGYERDGSTNNPMDVFYVGGSRYVGRYIGMIGGNVISSVGVFAPGAERPVNASAFRDPRGTDGSWLAAGSVVGKVSGTAFSSEIARDITAVAVWSDAAAFNTVAGGGDPDTVAIVSVASGGYREIFLQNDGRYVSRNPISSVDDKNVYIVSDLQRAYIERFFYKDGVLFALTTNAGLWTQESRSGVWVWE